MRLKVSRRRKFILLSMVLLATIGFLLIPVPRFRDPLSTVIYDKDGVLMGARVASDEQWRFPPSDTIPYRFRKSIQYFEDEYFYLHPGVNPISLVRATFQNISEGRVVSGGSTLSMQVVRLSRKGKSRTISEKLVEMLLALRLELSKSKEEILELYASFAPFGGNVVGLEAASWRYFNRPSTTLSWGEATALAVLPNAPSIIYPGKSEDMFQNKRNRLLEKLYRAGEMDSTTYSLSLMEELPAQPYALPNRLPHLLQTAIREGHDEEIIHSSIDARYQNLFSELLDRYHEIYSQNEVHNGAILVIDNRSRKIRAYVGNTNCPKSNGGSRVDIITSERSTGSLLKPYLYAAALDAGRISSSSLIPDIPTRIGDFSPKNFDKKYMGAVESQTALIRSLNVPAVRLLREFGLEKFNHLLEDIKLSSIDKGPDHYGLSIILGGAESTLLEMTAAYSAMAGQLNHYFDLNGAYFKSEYSPTTYLENSDITFQEKTQDSPFTSGAIWTTFNMLTELQRPRLEGDWKMFSSSKKIAWKTGTSYGFRDAWAIGVTPEYTVGVWVGNASGEGRPHLIGLEAASPIMFDVFSRLPATSWFTKPYDDIAEIEVCASSGLLPSPYCDAKLKLDHPFISSNKLPSCKYHRMVHLDEGGKLQVNSSCYAVDKMINASWFVLPPAMEWYYVKNSADYRRLPPFKTGCDLPQENPLQIIYPKDHTVIAIPKNLDGTYGRVVLEAAHHHEDIKVYWHLDDEFLEVTEHHHKIEILPEKGSHRLTLMDEQGNVLKIRFEVLE